MIRSGTRGRAAWIAWFLASLLVISQLGLAAELPSRERIQALFGEVAGITGLPPRKPVRYQGIRRNELSRDLQRRIQRTASDREVRDEELALQWMGLVPPDYNLRQSTVDLLTEQAAAFYDYRRRRLVLMENPLGEYEESVIAHELAHALADQHFRIGRYMDAAGRTDDAAMARMAVVEGQASWLMTEFELRRSQRGSLFRNSSLLPGWSSVSRDHSFGFPVLEKAPLYIRASLLFPYWEGGRFQAAAIERMGVAGFRHVFEHPPLSTQQILHPEVYWEGRRPEQLELPAWNSRGSRVISAGVLGELDFLIFFELANVSDAANLAQKWRGGRYEIRERRGVCCAIRLAATWEDDTAAAIVATVWKRFAGQKARRGELSIRHEGRRMEAIEGAEILQPK